MRTKDWVAPRKAPGAPGKFQVMVDGSPLKETFGTKSAIWHWHDGGTVEVGKEARIGLHDLTGFEGRCEAILFCKDTDFQPSNDVAALEVFRRKLLGLPDQPADGGNFDLVVLGGGLAGTCAALAAARQGLSVALVQYRPVPGWQWQLRSACLARGAYAKGAVFAYWRYSTGDIAADRKEDCEE